MTIDPLRAYAVALLHRAGIMPDAETIAAGATMLRLAEADVLALLREEHEMALWCPCAPVLVDSCIARIADGEHRGAAVRPMVRSGPFSEIKGRGNG